MSRPPQIELMVGGQKLAERVFQDSDIVGLWNKAIEAFNDSKCSGRSVSGQYRDLYEGSRIAATAICAAAGLQPTGQSHHHNAIAAAALLTSGDVSNAFHEVQGLRTLRHDANYTSLESIEAEDVMRLRDAFAVIIDEGAKQLREMRPSAGKAIHVVKTKPRPR